MLENSEAGEEGSKGGEQAEKMWKEGECCGAGNEEGPKGPGS